MELALQRPRFRVVSAQKAVVKTRVTRRDRREAGAFVYRGETLAIVDDVHIETLQARQPLQQPVDALQVRHRGQDPAARFEVARQHGQAFGRVVEVFHHAHGIDQIELSFEVGVQRGVEGVAAQDLPAHVGADQVRARQFGGVGFDIEAGHLAAEAAREIRQPHRPAAADFEHPGLRAEVAVIAEQLEYPAVPQPVGVRQQGLAQQILGPVGVITAALLPQGFA
jgi:hypothetical protein